MGEGLAKRLQPASGLGAQGASHPRRETGSVLLWLFIAVIEIMTESNYMRKGFMLHHHRKPGQEGPESGVRNRSREAGGRWFTGFFSSGLLSCFAYTVQAH